MTAPARAIRDPWTLVPVTAVMLVWAMMVPARLV